MISIGLRDFRGCERADLVCAPIALVAGRNATGKSSIAQAVGAALSGSTLPLAGLTKAAAGMLVKTGNAAARIEISGESGTCRIEWPACQATSEGQPPHASVWAAGLDSIVLHQAKDRARVLGEYLHADPMRGDLAAALADLELGDDAVVAGVWQLIEAHGWDGAHGIRKDKGAEFKGRWRQVTGANYGSRVAASWVPEGWQFELEPASENDLCAAIAQAKETHDKAIATAAVSTAERQRLGQEMAKIEDHKTALQKAEAEAEPLALALGEAQSAREQLPAGKTGPEMPCPHCGAFVVLRQVNLAESRLEPAETIPEAELKKRRLAIADADGAVNRLTGERHQAERAVELARDAMQIALDAKYRLERMPPAAEGGTDVEDAKVDLATAERRLAAFRQKREADDLARRIAGNDAVLAILAPDGLRARKLARVLEVFNSTQLQPLCEAASWRPVAIDAEMTLAYGGRPYALLSTSEQYRVRAIIQLAMARLDGSQMVVLDAADVLDGTTRSGLFAMLEEAGLPAVVCLTLSRPSQCPDLAEAGLGQSFWLSDGVARPLHEELANVAA
jgi:hypothetical protein